MRKKYFSHQEKLLKFEAEGQVFEITRTIYSNIESSEQVLFTECLFLISNELEQLEFKLEKNWDLETCRKS